MERKDAAVAGVSTLLAFAVGVLVGGRACGEVKVETVVEERLVPGPTTTVYECEPDAGAPQREKAVKAAGKSWREPARKLPKAEEKPDPRRRQRLLAWVRDQSVDLRSCTPGGREPTDVTVTLTLGERGEVKTVKLNSPPADIDSAARDCLRRRMAGWQPPQELVEEQRRLVFGLRI